MERIVQTQRLLKKYFEEINIKFNYYEKNEH